MRVRVTFDFDLDATDLDDARDGLNDALDEIDAALDLTSSGDPQADQVVIGLVGRMRDALQEGTTYGDKAPTLQAIAFTPAHRVT